MLFFLTLYSTEYPAYHDFHKKEKENLLAQLFSELTLRKCFFKTKSAY